MTRVVINRTSLVLEQGDITKVGCEAIVNAANSRLAGGGGVDGAIHRAGGPEIMAECRRIGGCETGSAVMTTAGDLPAQKVIHAVGPVYRGQPEDAVMLASCYESSLDLARDAGLRSIAFPGISTGVYGYPMEKAAEVSLTTLKGYLERFDAAFDEVRFVLFGAEAYEIHKLVLDRLMR